MNPYNEDTNTENNLLEAEEKHRRKERFINVRLTKEEQTIIQNKAQKSGLKPSSFMRKAALKSVVKAILDEEEKILLRQLVGMSNNLNQLAKLGHTQGLLSALMQFESYRKIIDRIVNKLFYGKE